MAEAISGIRTIQTSGAVFEAIVNSLPVSIFGGESGQRTGAKSGYDGSWGLNVFVIGQSGTSAGAGGGQVSGTVAVSGQVAVTSGGTLPVSMVSGSISGNYLNMAASGVGISHFSGALNVNISGGTINVSPFGLQSGTLVLISGGQLAISGLIVKTSGEYINLAASGVGISHFSGALNVNISGGTITVSPFGLQSGSMVLISGGQLAISGLIVKISGEYVNLASSGVGISHFSGALNVNISGGSISANVSGNVVGAWPATDAVFTSSPVLVTAASGGATIGSGVIISILLTNASGNADIYIGTSGSKPFSGFGYPLAAGASMSFDFDNLFKIYAVAITSGQKLGYFALRS